jgi:hypothetical protein
MLNAPYAVCSFDGPFHTVVQPSYRRKAPRSGMGSLKEIPWMVLQMFNILLKKGKLILKMVGIRPASVSHLQSRNAHHAIREFYQDW